MPAEVPICEIRFAPQSGFAFLVRFAGRPPHWQHDGFATIEDALQWIDPHHERVWIEPSDADESRVLISRAYRPGSIEERVLMR